MSAESHIAEPDARIQETQFSRRDGDSGEEGEANGQPTGQTSDYATIPSQRQPEPAKTTSKAKAPRVLGPDLLRGLLMILQSIDHASVSSGAWGHGQGTESEGDGQIVNTWISPVAWTARTLTHLCAPGFMFLLGMGVVYFGRSRSKLGWSNTAMIRHFFVRALVLAIVSEALGLIAFPGRIVILNTVLLALAFNYFIVGLLWLAINSTERRLTEFLASSNQLSKRNSDETRPLLANEAATASAASANLTLAAKISFQVHNVFLLALAIVTIWMNVWISPDNGRCDIASARSDTLTISPLMYPGMPSQTGLGPAADFWLYPVWSDRVMSGFPPLPWISFAIIGLLYARLVLAWPARPAYILNTANLCVGLLLLLLFAGTRLLHVGNLSENCLHMPEHNDLPADHNQYLASFRSFFYVVKYPPSPAFLFFTMGMNFIFLAAFGAIPESIGRRLPGLLVFGQSALFFYLLHLMLYAGFGALAKMWFGHENPHKKDPFKGTPAIEIGEGPVFWCMWALGLIVLYPVCRWYGGYKARKGPDSVFRFF